MNEIKTHPAPLAKILLIDSIHPVFAQRLADNGMECTDASNWKADRVIAEMPGFDGVQIRSKIKITKQVIDTCPKLKFIARAGAGMESIDLDYAAAKGIICINSPEGNKDAVAEHALGMLLCLFNKLHLANASVIKHLWEREKFRGIELKTKTVAIIGYGNMGSAFSERLKGFGCKVLVYDKYKTGFASEHIQEVALSQIFEQADILSLHIPLSQETQYLVDKNFIGKFKKPFYLVNTARGKIVNTEDLIAALKQQKVLGACLDVLEYEDHSFSEFSTRNSVLDELFTLDNVLLSPHIAGWTKESYIKIAEVLAQKVLQFFNLPALEN